VHVLWNYLVFDTEKKRVAKLKELHYNPCKSWRIKSAADRFTCSKTKQDRRLEAKSVRQET
jgi:hypothetical protein